MHVMSLYLSLTNTLWLVFPAMPVWQKDRAAAIVDGETIIPADHDDNFSLDLASSRRLFWKKKKYLFFFFKGKFRGESPPTILFWLFFIATDCLDELKNTFLGRKKGSDNIVGFFSLLMVLSQILHHPSFFMKVSSWELCSRNTQNVLFFCVYNKWLELARMAKEFLCCRKSGGPLA